MFQLKPHEQVIHPNPYVPEENPPLIITTQRVFHVTGSKKKELDASKISYSAKRNDKNIIILIGMFMVIALPFAIIGGLKVLTYKDKPTGLSPEDEAKKKAGQPIKRTSPKQLQEWEDNKVQMYLGVGLAGFAAIFVGASYLLYKRRLTVVVGGGGKRMQVRVKDKAAQDKVLMMIGAAQQSAKAMAATQKPPAQAPPKKK